ncbi:MAG: SRPBCC family protein [Sideroxydans sp.]|nr:SRPBCC family protein [Sideroxydans sp.]
MKTSLPLRAALFANAIFSLSSALLMIFRPDIVERWLGIQAQTIIEVIGIGLIIFASALIILATRTRISLWLALLASMADFMWVLGSVVLVFAWPELFSQTGEWVILAVAGDVLVFGVLQLWGIAQSQRVQETGEYQHSINIETNAPMESMWRVIGDLGNIKKYMPQLTSSEILGEKTPGVGAVRACSHGSQRWAEECTAFVPGHSFDVRFLTEAPDFPFPVTSMRGGWKVSPASNGSLVNVWWKYVPKHKILSPIFVALFARQIDRDFPGIIQRMALDAANTQNTAHM